MKDKKTAPAASAATSRTQQFKAFAAAHKGETFTASGLAKALGWSKKKTKKIKGEDGKPAEDIIRISHNSKAVVRLARKLKLHLEHKKHQAPKRPGEPEVVGRWTITL